MDWGLVLKTFRKQQHLTQEQLAARMRGVGSPWLRETVAGVERGIRALQAEELLGLRFLGLDLDRLPWRPRLVAVVPPTTAEKKVAKVVGWLPEKVKERAEALWHCSLDVERDRRLNLVDKGTRTDQARRGHVTRQLIRELQRGPQ